MSKHIGRSSIIGEQGIAHIRRTVLDMGHMFHETGGVEAGIDGYIELRDQDTGRVGNLILQVQGKATERERLPAETPDSFKWHCTEADVKYWRQGTAPVLLIVVQTNTNRAYWKSIRDYFPDTDAMQRRSIVFDKHNDVFNVSARTAISEVAANAKPGAIARRRELPNIWCPTSFRSSGLVLNSFWRKRFTKTTDNLARLLARVSKKHRASGL